MIKDYSAKDITVITTFCTDFMYEKVNEDLEETIYSIALRNQEKKGTPIMSFRFGGQTYQLDTQTIRFPLTLHSDLVAEMREVQRIRRKLDEEKAYVHAVVAGACSRSETASHLYQLLPVKLHPALSRLGIDQEISDPFKPLSEKVISEFQATHAVNLQMIDQRLTRNLLGIPV